jgi:diguanylate cyclase (GGDEF)-like protein
LEGALGAQAQTDDLSFQDAREFGRPRLLVVDDLQQNRDILCRRLKRAGFDTVEASGGMEALAQLDEIDFDAVLLDVMMPDLSGMEVLKRIRTSRTPADLPVIMVTANAMNEDVVSALDSGANDYITKPIDFQIAVSRVNRQVERRRAELVSRNSNETLAKLAADLNSEITDRVAELAQANAAVTEEAARRAASEEKVIYLAHHDPLTGLFNRFSFDRKLQAALSDPDTKNKSEVTVLFVDLDGFKMVNDTLGHDVGDALLKDVARRLRATVGADDMVARLGGDEFGVIHFAKEGSAQALADRIVGAVAECRNVDDHEVYVRASVGVAASDPTKTDAGTMLKHADLAMYRAKTSGGGTFRIFERAMEQSAQRRRQLEIELRRAAQHEEFELHYQPIVDLAGRRVAGFEALMRWTPRKHRAQVQELISLAEDIGLIGRMGKWAVHTACQEAARWRNDICVAVNLSPRQFRDDDLVQIVADALTKSGLNPERLELEITESVLLDRCRHTIETLNRIRQLGVRISLDDFGTGYAGLSYIRDFRFDKLKIDRSFIKLLPSDPTSAAIVRAAMGLATNLGMVTLGEGVENDAELSCLLSEGCLEAQGFLFGEAKPAATVPEMVRSIEMALAGRDRDTRKKLGPEPSVAASNDATVRLSFVR